MRKRQQYISRSARTGDEIKDIRNLLDNSMSNVIRDQSLDPILLETETRKLDDSLELQSSFPVRGPSRRRISPVRGSPARFSSTPVLRRTGSPISLRKKLQK